MRFDKNPATLVLQSRLCPGIIHSKRLILKMSEFPGSFSEIWDTLCSHLLLGRICGVKSTAPHWATKRFGKTNWNKKSNQTHDISESLACCRGSVTFFFFLNLLVTGFASLYILYSRRFFKGNTNKCVKCLVRCFHLFPKRYNGDPSFLKISKFLHLAFALWECELAGTRGQLQEGIKSQKEGMRLTKQLVSQTCCTEYKKKKKRSQNSALL